MSVKPVPTVVHTATAPRDIKKRPLLIELFDENGSPLDLGGSGGSGGGGVPNPVPWSSLMPYAGPGVRDYNVVYPGDGFDSPGYYAAGGEVFLKGVFELAQQSGTTIVTFPAALRPPGVRCIQVQSSSGTRSVYIFPDGRMEQAGGSVVPGWAVLGGSYLL